VLLDLYTLASQHADLSHPHTTAVLQAMSAGQTDAGRNLQALAGQGLVRAGSKHTRGSAADRPWFQMVRSRAR
jgi:hypothetical protein